MILQRKKYFLKVREILVLVVGLRIGVKILMSIIQLIRIILFFVF
tara:strand:- start:11371 stop:11505 length:135 start_codon:yes stop_codon:yes gene_type:complete